MAFSRARALLSLQSTLRPRLAAPARTRLAVGRRYASGGGHGGGHGEASSDLPWMAGAIAVTIPSCWYLWPDTSHADSGHHGGHGAHAEEHGEEHAEEHEEKEEEPAGEEKPQEEGGEKEEPEQKDEGGEQKEEGGEKKEEGSEKKDDAAETTTPEHEAAKESEDTAKPSGSEGESQPASDDANKASHGQEEPESKETPDHKGSSEGAQFKGKVAGEGRDDTRKREPDSKGAFKKRIDSGLGKNIGEAAQDGQEGAEDSSTAKTPQKGEEGAMTGKQFGLSNTATRHSTDPSKDPEKSSKGDGTPETAKAMGTVSPNAPVK